LKRRVHVVVVVQEIVNRGYFPAKIKSLSAPQRREKNAESRRVMILK
jgi:hypothetical protein